jgi:hypothetical protein
MVAETRQRTWERAMVIGLALIGISACSAFDPVKETRFKWLRIGDDAELGISGARWVVYSDAHSLTSACTNGAAGNHHPDQCTVVDKPRLPAVKEPHCPEHAGGPGELIPGLDGSICMQGRLRKPVPCEPASARCVDKGDDNRDLSNMWGAGVGLMFSEDGKTPWNANDHHVRGVAFDLSGLREDELGKDALNVRVELPIVLDPKRQVPDRDQPLTRDDGSVIGTDGRLYSYNCTSQTVNDSDFPDFPAAPQRLRLEQVLSDPDAPQIVTSDLHPSGSPFWQEGSNSDWVPSPLHVGRNEFSWTEVLAPRDSDYEFDETQLLGVHFQVVHAQKNNPDELPFSLCIKNLALLLEE